MKNKEAIKNLDILLEMPDCNNKALFSFMFSPLTVILLSCDIVASAKKAIKKHPILIKNDIKFFEITKTRTEISENRKIIIILTKCAFLLLKIKIMVRQITAKNKIRAVSNVSKIPEVNKLLENSPLVI